MLNINFNEAWNDLDSLNEKKQTRKKHTNKQVTVDTAPISYKYTDMKEFLDKLLTFNNKDNKDFEVKAKEINDKLDQMFEIKRDLRNLMSNFKNTFSTNDIARYNELKTFENSINSYAYTNAQLGGPRRLALIYDTYLIENAINKSGEPLQKSIIDLIKSSENVDASAAVSLTWTNDAVQFNRISTNNKPDFICKISGTEDIGLEVKIAVFTDTIEDKFTTKHSHNAKYIARYYPNSGSGCFVIYKRAELTDDASVSFVPIGDIKFSRPTEFLDINSFPGYWPQLPQLTHVDTDNTNSN